MKLIQKYYSLRQQYWTHILLPFTYIFLLFMSLGKNIYQEMSKASDVVPIALFLLGEGIYALGVILTITVAIICIFLKKKVTNKFLLDNILYGLIWHAGNIITLPMLVELIHTIIEIFTPQTYIPLGEINYTK